MESIWTETVGGVGLNEKEVKESVENDEQPAKPSPAMALTMTRRMVYPSLVAANCHSPQRDHRGVPTATQPYGLESLIDG